MNPSTEYSPDVMESLQMSRTGDEAKASNLGEQAHVWGKGETPPGTKKCIRTAVKIQHLDSARGEPKVRSVVMCA